MSAKWKKVTQDGVEYLVSRTEFPDRIVYAAWEKAINKPGKTAAFIGYSSHATQHKDENKVKWGNITTRVLPEKMLLLTPKSPERLKAEHEFRVENVRLEWRLVEAGFSIATGLHTAKNGELTEYRAERVEMKEPKATTSARSPVVNDPVKKMLEMVALPRLRQLAELNGVPVKPTDSAGLLKMRIQNAFRKIIKDGGTIKE